MYYKERPGYEKTFIVCRFSGFGVMEDPYKEEEVVFQADTEEEATIRAEELTRQNNTSNQIVSTWIPNTYWVSINTLTDEGKALQERRR